VIRYNDNSNTVIVHPDFMMKSIAYAPLNSEDFEADHLIVFNFLMPFMTNYSSRDWIKNTLRYSDGRRSMAALRDHFLSKGNAFRSLAKAEQLKLISYYKNEIVIIFEIYLTQC